MMKTLWMISFFIIGTVLGSFYNVLGYRVPLNKSIVYPGSFCPRCGHDLKWYELIPVISYIFLGGKCRNCKQPISLMYPFIELFCGILFMVSYYSFGFSGNLFISLILVSLLCIVIVSDVNYMIIPDVFLIVASILIIITKLISVCLFKTLLSIGYGIIAFVIMYLVSLLGNKVFKKETLGGADIKLFFIIGLIFNPLMSMMVLLLASVIAFPISLFIFIKNKENAIPFGPFIVLSLVFLFWTKIDFNTIINFLSEL